MLNVIDRLMGGASYSSRVSIAVARNNAERQKLREALRLYYTEINQCCCIVVQRPSAQCRMLQVVPNCQQFGSGYRLQKTYYQTIFLLGVKV